MAIKTIFWDIGGVLLNNGWDHDERRNVLTPLNIDFAEYEKRHHDANPEWECGLIDEKAFFNRTIFYQPRNFTLDQLWSLVKAESKLLHPDSFELLSNLKASKKYKLATLNNESRELNDYRLHAFGLVDLFDFFVCSGYVNQMKPHPTIYRSAYEIAGNPPEQSAFIDDKAENAEAATAAGMHGITFHSAAQLKDELAALGVTL